MRIPLAPAYKYVKFLGTLMMIIIILESTTYSHCSLDPELHEAVQHAINYFNQTENLADRVEMVNIYYQLEWEEGIFVPARITLIPKILEKVNKDFETLEFDAKNKRPGDKKILRRINDIHEELTYNYGAADKNFRIQRDDPYIANMRAVERMEKHWEGVMEEFREYTQSQRNMIDSLKILKDAGIHLAPENDDMFVMVTSKDGLNELLEKYPKADKLSNETDENSTFADILEKINLQNKDTPKQTSQEIKALQGVLQGQELDFYTKEMLRGFIPELNQRCTTIMQKLIALENVVGRIKDESQNYGTYLWDKRDELHDELSKLRKRFENKYQDEL